MKRSDKRAAICGVKVAKIHCLAIRRFGLVARLRQVFMQVDPVVCSCLLSKQMLVTTAPATSPLFPPALSNLAHIPTAPHGSHMNRNR